MTIRFPGRPRSRTLDWAGGGVYGQRLRPRVPGPIQEGAPALPSFTRWWADVPPAGAHAKDDEFDDAALDIKWTEWDPAAKMAISETEVGAEMVHTADGALHFAGMHQDVISGDYSIWTRVAQLAKFTAGGTANHFWGLLLLEDADDNPNTSDGYLFGGFLDNTNEGIVLCKFTAYNTYGSTLSLTYMDDIPATHFYLRIRKATATYAFDISRDGIGWKRVYSGALDFAPEQFGLGSLNNGNVVGDDHKLAFTFFRATEATPSLLDVEDGDRAKIFIG